MTDVTDTTFESAVLARSDEIPVIVDLWAPWCGPCRTLGPLLEAAVAERAGKVELAKVNIDESPSVSAAFSVQSIPAVYAIRERKVVDHFLGAVPRNAVEQFVDKLAPKETEVDRLVSEGSETSLRAALELEPGHEKAVLALALLLVRSDRREEALGLLARIPDSPESRRLAAEVRSGTSGGLESSAIEGELQRLLTSVKSDDAARQRYLDLLELMGPDDPRTVVHRKALSQALF